MMWLPITLLSTIAVWSSIFTGLAIAFKDDENCRWWTLNLILAIGLAALVAK